MKRRCGLIIYLSCDSNNSYFIKTVIDAVDELKKRLSPDSVELIYPPKQIGGDTGKVLTNVLRIREADLVIFDVTPTVDDDGAAYYNPGVMIEFGIVLALEYPQKGQPWEGRLPKPVYRVLCSSNYSRGNLTPLVNEASVISYNANNSEDLAKEINSILEQRISQRMRFSYQPSAESNSRVQGYPTYT